MKSKLSRNPTWEYNWHNEQDNLFEELVDTAIGKPSTAATTTAERKRRRVNNSGRQTLTIRDAEEIIMKINENKTIGSGGSQTSNDEEVVASPGQEQSFPKKSTLKNLKIVVKAIEEKEKNIEDSASKQFNIVDFASKSLGLKTSQKKRIFSKKYIDQEYNRIHDILDDRYTPSQHTRRFSNRERTSPQKFSSKPGQTYQPEPEINLLTKWREEENDPKYDQFFDGDGKPLFTRKPIVDKKMVKEMFKINRSNSHDVRERAWFLVSNNNFEKKGKSTERSKFYNVDDEAQKEIPELFSYDDIILKHQLVNEQIKKGRKLGAFSMSYKGQVSPGDKTGNKKALGKTTHFTFSSALQQSNNKLVGNDVIAEEDEGEQKEGNQNGIGMSLPLLSPTGDMRFKLKKKVKDLMMIQKLTDAMQPKKSPDKNLLAKKLGDTKNDQFFEKIIKTAKNIYYNNQAVNSIRNVKGGNYDELPFAEQMKTKFKESELKVLVQAEKTSKKIDINLKKIARTNLMKKKIQENAPDSPRGMKSPRSKSPVSGRFSNEGSPKRINKFTPGENSSPKLDFLSTKERFENEGSQSDTNNKFTRNMPRGDKMNLNLPINIAEEFKVAHPETKSTSTFDIFRNTAPIIEPKGSFEGVKSMKILESGKNKIGSSAHGQSFSRTNKIASQNATSNSREPTFARTQPNFRPMIQTTGNEFTLKPTSVFDLQKRSRSDIRQGLKISLTARHTETNFFPANKASLHEPSSSGKPLSSRASINPAGLHPKNSTGGISTRKFSRASGNLSINTPSKMYAHEKDPLVQKRDENELEKKAVVSKMASFVRDCGTVSHFNRTLNNDFLNYTKHYSQRNFQRDFAYEDIFREYATEPESKEVMEKAHKIYLMAAPGTRKKILRKSTKSVKTYSSRFSVEGEAVPVLNYLS